MEIPTTRRGAARARRGLLRALAGVGVVGALSFVVPSAFGYRGDVIEDRAMSGTMGHGALAFQRSVPVADLAVGDVITYLPPRSTGVDDPVTRRIIAIHGNAYRTRGDAAERRDPWTYVPESPTQPRVEHAVPYLGLPWLVLSDPDSWMALVGLPAAGLAVVGISRLAHRTPVEA